MSVCFFFLVQKRMHLMFFDIKMAQRFLLFKMSDSDIFSQHFECLDG